MKRIPLRRRDGTIRAEALVDEGDFEWLSQWRWCLNGEYVRRTEFVNGKQRAVLLHRQILGLEYGDPRQGEHRNRNPLDCRRSNLRIAGRGQADNQQNQGIYRNNTSGYRGVGWHKSRRKWQAYASLGGEQKYLGIFATAEEADAVAKAFRGAAMPFSDDAA